MHIILQLGSRYRICIFVCRISHSLEERFAIERGILEMLIFCKLDGWELTNICMQMTLFLNNCLIGTYFY